MSAEMPARQRRRLLAAACSAFALLSAQASAQATAAPNLPVLRVAGVPISGMRSRGTEEMLDRWRQRFMERTGMDVDFVDHASGDVSTDLRTVALMARMSSIDVAAVDTIHVGALAEHVRPIDDPALLDRWHEQVRPGEMSSHFTGDQQLAIPWYADYGMMFYRVDLLEKYGIPPPGPEGWTYDEFEDIARRVQAGERADGVPEFTGFVWTGQDYEGLTCLAMEVMEGHGAYPLVDRRGGVAVDNPSLIGALERMASWIWGPAVIGNASVADGTEDAISPSEVLSFREADVRRRFCERGDAMFARHWPSFIADCETEGMAGKFGVVRNPGRIRGEGHGILGGQAMVVSKDTPYYEQALTFIDLITSREWQEEHWEVSHRIPVRVDLDLNASLCSGAHAKWCRIGLDELARHQGFEIRFPGSALGQSVIVGEESGRCGDVGHVATVCDVDATGGYISARPSLQAGAGYASVSEAFRNAVHEGLSNVVHGDAVRRYAKKAACAVVQAQKRFLQNGGGSGLRFASRLVEGGGGDDPENPLCDFERLDCSHGLAEGGQECAVCGTIWIWNDICGDPLVYSIAALCLVMSLVIGYMYVVRTRRQADAVWKVKITELDFGKGPAEVLGRGTFGLVLKAEYRGTAVAVKRVIPPGSSRNFSDFGSFVEASLATERTPVPPSATKSPSIGSRSSRSILSTTRVGGMWRSTATPCSPECSPASRNPSGTPAMPRTTTTGSAATAAVLRLASRAGGTGGPANERARHRERLRALLWGHAEARHADLKQNFIKEMRLLSKLRHPCVLTVMGAVISKRSEPMLVMELMEHGSLYDLLHNETLAIDAEWVLPILRDITQGLRFLHAARPCIVHGDLKAQNVLVDSKFRAKVADFGLSQKAKVGACGTPLWMAPELLRGSPGSPASDVYALGITLSEVYSRQDPYFGEDPLDVLEAVSDAAQHKRPDVPSACAPEVAVLMRDCWQEDPSLRPACDEIDRRLKALAVASADAGAWSLGMRSPVLRRGKTNELLNDVFPPHVAEALRAGRKVEPESREVVTIFFSDIVGFTDISTTLPAQKVSLMLDRLYSKFDQLSEQHRIFKVETIGDAYMAVANLVEDQPDDHAKRIAAFAADAVRAANKTLIDEDDVERGCVNIRVGFHSGPVVANVVGTRNLRYCLFGDTVNTASRMESTSERNRIHCSSQAAHFVREQAPEIALRPRGNIAVKGKGNMFTFWVHESATPGPAHEAGRQPLSLPGVRAGSSVLHMNI